MTENIPLDLMKQFLEIEIKYIDKIIADKPPANQKILRTRRMMMSHIVTQCTELKTPEGIEQIKKYIEEHKHD